jgi:hypothetical protein
MTAVALQSFGFGDQLVRVTDQNGGVWFVANDVCGALELGNPRQVVARLEDDERDCVHIMDAIGREQETTVVSESGVYALIFTSRKPIAKQFRKWVTSEVLPAIRKTGRYADGVHNMDVIGPDCPDDEFATAAFYEKVRVCVPLVREARALFGRNEARRVWKRLGLPDVGPPPEQLVVSREMHRQVQQWVSERVERAVGNRVQAQAMYMDYARWCGEGGEKADNPVVFGRALPELGLAKMTSGNVFYLDVRLKD